MSQNQKTISNDSNQILFTQDDVNKIVCKRVKREKRIFEKKYNNF